MKLDIKNCGRYQGFLEARRAFENQLEEQVGNSELSPELAYEALVSHSLCLIAGELALLNDVLFNLFAKPSNTK